MDRRQFLKAAGTVAATIPFTLESVFSADEKSKKPNIVFIFSDDHAVQAISAYGSKINKTPNIDRIAKEGAILDRCYCCNSICAPSRAAILTGKHSHANGLMTNLNTFDGSQQTFPKLLQKAGYQTGLIGKWHLKTAPTGFDHWEILPGQGSYYNPDFKTAEGRKRYTGYVTDIVTDLSLEWLDSRDESKPFMLMCQHKAPHRIWAPGPDHLTMYDDVEIPEPDTLFDDYSNRTDLLKKNEMEIGRHMMYDYDLKVTGSKKPDALGRKFANFERNRMTEEQRKKWDAAYEPKNEEFRQKDPKGKDLVRWKYQRYIKDYLRCVASVDDNIGRVLDYLKEKGLDRDTIVIYSSDQGFYLGEHGWYDKRWMFEESFRMPFVIKWPGVAKPGTRVKAFGQNIDFGPTFLDAAGRKVPADMHGVSLRPILDGKPPENWRDSLYYHYYEKGEHNVPPHHGVRTQRYKLMQFYDAGEWQFFDLKKDPQELVNRYNDPEYSDQVKTLKKELIALMEKYKVKKPPIESIKATM
ncbi:Arylsulfatase [Anaerohalosphaera lusitana]|uniref:Arylsulfatase n=1 Tax=Anaerohalosphaera lusitana TaxID=1936003 RepID=A0A1U9NPJ3_9BACT|nr:sulfatase [Anaerohalosphaera lusitana]AQT69426.1 Arylsulfatase [Anaerohalosphaera lusitana]